MFPTTPCTVAFKLLLCMHVCVSSADFEYEVAWQGLSSLKFNKWLPRSELIEKGFRWEGFCRRG